MAGHSVEDGATRRMHALTNDAMPALGIAALRTARAGWWVFPARPGDKTPAAPAAHPTSSRSGCRGECGRWGHGLHDATTDPAMVRALWERWPRANIAVSCGPSEIVVIDLDTTTGTTPPQVLREQAIDDPVPANVTDAASALAWLCARRGGDLDDLQTLTVATPTGGRHLYYRAPDPGTGLQVTSGAGMTSGLGWGIDVRAWGGYVVAPPSVRPEGTYRSLGGPLRELPGWLLNALADVGRVLGREPTAEPGSAPERPAPRLRLASDATADDVELQRRHRYLTAAVQGEIERVCNAPFRGLNDTLTRAAFALGQLVAGAGLDEDQAAYALLVAAHAASGVHVSAGGKPFDETKTRSTIARGLAAGAAHPRTARP